MICWWRAMTKQTTWTIWRKPSTHPSKCVFVVSSGKFLGFIVSQRGIKANPDKIKAIMEVKCPKTVKEVQKLIGKVAALNRFVSRAIDKCLPFFKVLKKAFSVDRQMWGSLDEAKRVPNAVAIVKPFNNKRKAATLFGSIQHNNKLDTDQRRGRHAKAGILP